MDAMYVRYVQGSTAIEGNTITLREAQELLDDAISPTGKKMDEVYEILNFLKLGSFLSDTVAISGSRSSKVPRDHDGTSSPKPGDYRNIQSASKKSSMNPARSLYPT